MSQTETPAARREPVPLNGVDTPNLFATINAVKGTPDLANFQFRARNEWVRGTNSRSRIESFSGAGGEHKHARAFEFDADHPAVLVGGDAGPTPVEFLLRGAVELPHRRDREHRRRPRRETEPHRIEGRRRHRLRGILGLSNEVRNGYRGFASTSRSRATRRPRRCRGSSNSRPRDRPYST